MNQRAAFDATVRLARSRGMARVKTVSTSLSWGHLLSMQESIHAGEFSDAKLGRWLGWAQAAVVAANIGVTLSDVKRINMTHSEPGDTP